MDLVRISRLIAAEGDAPHFLELTMDFFLLATRLVLAAVFAVASIAKLMDLSGSRKAVADFGVPARFTPAAGLALPLAEVAIALLLLPISTARWGAVGALLLLLTFIAAIGFNMLRGQAPDCHCFGQLHSEPAGPATLIRNGILAGMATFMLVAGWSNPGASLARLLPDRAAIGASQLVWGGIVLGLIVVWVVGRLVRQNGLRQSRLETMDIGPTSDDAPTDPGRVPERLYGLPVGTPAPDFSLPDLAGNPVSLADLRRAGWKVLLLFTDPGCGPCRTVLQHVSQWQNAADDKLHIEVISQGNHDANVAKAREYGLSRVLLQSNREVPESYAIGGTPAAVLIERDGTISVPQAGGFEAIRDLVAAELGNDAAPSLQKPEPALRGLAPQFVLPSLKGYDISLAGLLALGRPVMLHFTDPRCGPCYELLPDIGGWQRVYGERITSVIVSGGTSETNRLMTNEYGIDSNLVLLQSEREVFESLRLSQLPASVVIDPDGEIRSDPAYGAHAVRQLAASTLGLRLPDQLVAQVRAATLGETAPIFRRPDIHGNPVEVGVPQDGGTMLLFWNPGCPHCESLLPELKKLEARPGTPNVVVVSRGPVGLNRELGLASPIVLDDDRMIARAFGSTGTPAAIVIDDRGVIASDIGRGATGVRAFFREGASLGTATRETSPALRSPLAVAPVPSLSEVTSRVG